MNKEEWEEIEDAAKAHDEMISSFMLAGSRRLCPTSKKDLEDADKLEAKGVKAWLKVMGHTLKQLKKEKRNICKVCGKEVENQNAHAICIYDRIREDTPPITPSKDE